MAEKENDKSESALREESVLKFWQENKIFEKSLKKSSPKGEFVFYEGPPTANGKPGIHHLEARSFKDAIPRYKTMRGYHVRRKGGWDTHGLPVELQVEKKLGLDSKKAIEEYGIAKFNQECKESVWEYVDLWEKFTERVGYWVDQENPYVTYHNSYIESLWNIVKKVDEQKLLFKDYKVVPWCPRCGTTLSSHELAQGYEDVKDLSIYAKFKVKGQENTYLLAWTTTPWTLPGNVALAVGKDIDYVKIQVKNEKLILAKERLSVVEEESKIIEEMKGSDIVGLEYEPLYPYFSDTIEGKEKDKLKKAYKVYEADFVTTQDGTGIVHTAVMYGQDDFVLGTAIGLPKHHLVGLDGKFLPGTDFLEGRFVRDEEVSVDIIKDLAHRNLLFKKEKYAHSYPHCWRCHTALIYYARDSWYIKMSDPKIKEKLISENQKINWEPSHIKDGRFGEWLKDIKDWAISRERYWGTPLPVWQCTGCKKTKVIGGVDELKEKTKKSGNKYFFMRHGETKSNIKRMVSCSVEDQDHLTEKGKKEVLDSIPGLKEKKIDLIISSDLVRTKETAEIVKKELNMQDDELIFDKRLREFNVGVFEGKNWKDYWKLLSEKDFYNYVVENGESLKNMRVRMSDFFYDIEKKYKDKNILVISHAAPMKMILISYNGESEKETLENWRTKKLVLDNAEIAPVPFIPLPHNKDYELDLHRPYIDEAELVCDCGGNLIRTKEVMDVWFDSGAMPFAQEHYPFENKKWVEGPGYPADFISEAIDQTRGWFYTLHAIGVLMGKGRAYKNVICLGHLLDADGKKMSKSLGNIVDPWDMIPKYGVDTLRLWMYSVNQPGESKNFDEKTVSLLHRQVFGLLYNVLSFYELYKDKGIEREGKSNNILDRWILARLNELAKLSTENMDNYKLLEPVRAIRDFIDDLSTWYLRRSRERIKEGDKEAKQTLYFVLKNLTKLLAPFAPFSAEDIWQKLKKEKDEESVHLSNWPEQKKPLLQKVFGKKDEKLIEDMRRTRQIVTLGLEARQKAGIKVRQPLWVLKVKDLNLPKEYLVLVKEELNVKEVIEDKNLETEVFLETNITPELKSEGDYREFVRAIQDMRKKLGLTPDDIVSLYIDTNEKGKELIQKFEADLKKSVSASEIEFKGNGGEEIKIEEMVFKVEIKK